MELAKPIEEYDAVQTWFGGLRAQWGEEPSDKEGKLRTLADFCGLVERDPDAIVADCSIDVESGKRIRIKARRLYSEKIEEFQASVDGGRLTRGKAGNTIRSFMIHNGIFMQGDAQG